MNLTKVCAVCKHADHNVSLGERKEIICIINPNKPTLKSTSDTCLKYEDKYRNIKIIQDSGTLMEYDPSTESSKKVSREEFELNDIEEPAVIANESGQEEIPWDL